MMPPKFLKDLNLLLLFLEIFYQDVAIAEGHREPFLPFFLGELAEASLFFLEALVRHPGAPKTPDRLFDHRVAVVKQASDGDLFLQFDFSEGQRSFALPCEDLKTADRPLQALLKFPFFLQDLLRRS